VPPAASVSSKATKVKLIESGYPVPTEVLVKPRASVTMTKVNSELAKAGTFVISSAFKLQFVVVPVPKGKSAEQFSAELSKATWVERASPNYYFKSTEALYLPSDPYFADYQWNMYASSMPAVWDMAPDATPVIVAVLDTGVWGAHPDLSGRVIGYIDTINNASDPRYNIDDQGHGTHVAGIIAAIVGNNSYIAGMNHNSASILAIKCMNKDPATGGGTGTAASLALAIRAAVDYGGVSVISMSLGFEQGVYVPEIADEVENAYDEGIAIVASSGNDYGQDISFPANLPDVISVGAMDSEFMVSDFSNVGWDLDFVAPGGSIAKSEFVLSLYPFNVYLAGMMGTSQAAPHVSALLAMMLQQGLSRSQAVQIMTDTSQKTAITDMYNVINAYAALKGLTHDGAQYWLSASSAGVPLSGVFSGNIDRAFSITYHPGDYYLVGWVDANGNALIDEGDYSSIAPVHLVTGSNSLLEVFELNYMYTDALIVTSKGLGVTSTQKTISTYVKKTNTTVKAPTKQNK